MTIKIVTDSTADIPSALTKELGITVVPLYVRFGDETYRDRIDITEDEFYQRLMNDPIHPNTSQPTPQDFANVYRELCQQADGDEAGTEAAAATAVIMELTAMPETPVKVTLDRPFIFLIRDIETGAILFIGRVINPVA